MRGPEWHRPRDRRHARRALEALEHYEGRDRALRRALEIRRLPWRSHRGRVLRELRCTAGHPYNAPRGLCYALISLERFRCPWHAR